MKRFVYNIIIVAVLTVMAIAVKGDLVSAAPDSFTNIQESFIEFQCNETDLNNEDGVIRGIYHYNDFMIIPVTYPSVATAERNQIFVYDISGSEPVFYTKWNMDDLGMTVRDASEAANNDSIYGFAINEGYMYTVVNLPSNSNNLGLYEYTNPLISPAEEPALPERLVSNRVSATAAKCSIIENTSITASGHHANSITVKDKNGYLIIFYDLNKIGQTGTVIKVIDVNTPKSPTVKAALKLSALTYNNITPTTLCDVVFDGDYAYILTTDADMNYAVFKLDVSIPTNIEVVDALLFEGDSAEYAALNITDGFGYVTSYNANPQKTALVDGEYHLYTIDTKTQMSFIKKFVLDSSIYYGNSSTGIGAIAVVGDCLIGIDGYGHRNGGTYLKLSSDRTTILDSRILTDFAAEYKKNSNAAVVIGNRAYFAFKTSQHSIDNCGLVGSFEFMNMGASWEEDIPLKDNGDFYVDFSPEYLATGENTITVSGTNNSGSDMTYTVIGALYNNGMLVKTEISDKEIVSDGNYFSVEVDITVDEAIDIADAKMLVYIWDDSNNITPLGTVYSQSEMAFSFTIEEPCRASAGVYDQNDVLIRTLWSAKEFEQGTYTDTWNGKNDDGNLVSDGTYTVKILTNNVKYEHQDFAIGSTSDNTGTERGIYGYCTFFDMIKFDDRFYYATHYNENAYGVYSISVDSPTTKVVDQIGDYVNMNASRIATDGNYLYVGAQEQWNSYAAREYKTPHNAFIYAHDINNNFKTVTFDYGEHISCAWNDANGIVRYPSALNISQLDSDEYDFNQIGGLEVQQNGNLLISAYTTLGKLYINEKWTGELIASYDFLNPISIDLENDKNLWIAHEKNGKSIVSKYKVNTDGTIELLFDFDAEFDTVISIEVSPDCSKLVVIDAGNTNKVKVFNTETEELIMTFGNGESYETDPTVKDDKLWFRRDVWKYTNYYNSFITFEDDDSFWFGDSGNMRVLKLDISNGTPVVANRIMFLGSFYNVEVDANNAGRLFADTMEYSIDYSKESLKDGWNLEKNYSARLHNLGIGKGLEHPFRNVTTLSNELTYFESVDKGSGNTYLYYIDKEGKIFNTGFDVTGKSLQKNGDLLTRKTESENEKWCIETLRGFDENNVPIYDDEVTVSSVSSKNDRAPLKGKNDAPITESNILVSAVGGNSKSPNYEGTKMHLGGILLGTDGASTDWKWKAMPETYTKYNGPFPDDGAIDIGNGVEYSINGAQSIGRNIIVSYRGEFYRGSQTNKFLHYYDNGLFIGEYGTVFNEYANGYDSTKVPYIVASNALDAAVILSPNTTDEAYIFNNSEAMGGGVHVWKVTGLDSIKEQLQTVSLKTGDVAGVLCEVYNSANLDTAEKIRERIMNNISVSDMISGYEGNRSFRFSGYIEAENSGKYNFVTETDGLAEMWVNGYKIISGTGITAGAINLKKDVKYDVEIRVTPQNGVLSYIKAGRKEGNTYYHIGEEMHCDSVNSKNYNIVNLLEGPVFGETVKSGDYGWTYSLIEGDAESSGASIETNYWTYDRNSVGDLYIRQWGPSHSQSYVERNLGTGDESLNRWSVTSVVRFAEFMARINLIETRGQKIEILDSADKVIAWILLSEPYDIYANGKMFYSCENGSELGESISFRQNSDFVWPNILQFSAENGLITIKYKDASVTVEPYDEEADWSRPSKIRLNRYNHFSAGVYPSTINFISLTYGINEIEDISKYEYLTKKKLKSETETPTEDDPDSSQGLTFKEGMNVNSNNELEIYYSGYSDEEVAAIVYDVTNIEGATANTAFVNMETTPLIGVVQAQADEKFVIPLKEDYSGSVVIILGGMESESVRMLVNIEDGQIK